MSARCNLWTSSRAFPGRRPARLPRRPASPMGMSTLMIYDAFAHLPLYGSAISASCRMKRPASSLPTATRPGGKLPLNYQRRRSQLHASACTACMPCRRACQMRGSRRRKCRARRFRFATATVACSGERHDDYFYERTVIFRHSGDAPLGAGPNHTPIVVGFRARRFAPPRMTEYHNSEQRSIPMASTNHSRKKSSSSPARARDRPRDRGCSAPRNGAKVVVQ